MTAARGAALAAPATAHEQVVELLTRFGDHSSGFLVLNREMEHFVARGCEGLVGYRLIGRRHAVQLCSPFCAVADRARVLDEFMGWLKGTGRRLCAIQLRPGDVPLYAERDFSVDQVGCSYSIDLEQFSLRGTRFMKTRNKISRARRLGLTVEEGPDGGDAADLANVDAEWLHGKGWHANELAFLIGERGGPGAPLRRVFRGCLDGRALAYITYSPVLGTEAPGWLYDLTRRSPDAPPGAIELMFVSALEQMREEGVRWLHLGLTPFVGLDEEHRHRGLESRGVRTLIEQIGKRGRVLYPAQTQEAFKTKWGPHTIEPEYVAFEGGPSLGAVLGLMRLTKTIP